MVSWANPASTGAGGLEREPLVEVGEQGIWVDVAVQAVDRSDAQLLGDELADVGHRQLGAPGVAVRRGTHLVAVGAGDRVPVVAVGDQHRVRRDGTRRSRRAVRDR